jgi:hypothetical protein
VLARSGIAFSWFVGPWFSSVSVLRDLGGLRGEILPGLRRRVPSSCLSALHLSLPLELFLHSAACILGDRRRELQTNSALARVPLALMNTCPTCQPTCSDEVDFCPRHGAALRKEGIVRAANGREKETR